MPASGGSRLDDQPLHRVFELADVARPRVLAQRRHRVLGDALDDGGAVGESLEEVIDQLGDVFSSLAQRRDDEVNDVEAIEQVLAKVPVGDHRAEVAVGRGNDAHVHPRAGAIRPDLLQLSGLEEPQQQALHPQRHLADLVEKHRALVGVFELAGLVAIRASEAAFDMAEQLGLEQRLGHAGAVDRAQTARVPGGCRHGSLGRPAPCRRRFRQ